MCCQHVNRLDGCLADSGTHAPSVLTHASASCFTIWPQTEGKRSGELQGVRLLLYSPGDGKHFKLLAWMLTWEI